MKAIVCKGYGTPNVLQLEEIKKPTPKANEVLVRVFAASVTAADIMMRKGTPYIGRLFIGLPKPKNPTPGTGFSGVVEATGQDVRTFKKGDQVFGESIFSLGTNAEYTCVSEHGIIALKPENMTYEEAAPVCDGALTSINFLKILAKIKSGQRVLINGASGSLGTAAVQLAKYYGAEVTGICSASNLEMVAALGADKVIDYQKDGFTQSGEKYDIIYDTVGKSPFASCKASLTEKGVYICPVLSMSLLFQVIWTSIAGTKKAMFSATGTLPVLELRMLLQWVVQIIEEGKLKSVMDRSYPLENIIEAHSYVEKGHKKGNVVVIMNSDLQS